MYLKYETNRIGPLGVRICSGCNTDGIETNPRSDVVMLQELQKLKFFEID